MVLLKIQGLPKKFLQPINPTKMNDTFEFRRFGLLLKKTILERPMQIIGPFIITLGTTLLIYSAALYLMGWGPAQAISFAYGYVGGGCFLASTVFNYFNTNASGSAYLTLPVSALEKWLCSVVIVGVIFSAVFFGFYRIMDACFVNIYHNRLDKHSPLYEQLYDAVHIFTFYGNRMVYQPLTLYLNLVGALLVGALYFNRISAVKVAMVYVGLIAVVYFLNMALAHILFNNVDSANPFFAVFIKVGNDTGKIELPHLADQMVGIAWCYIIPGALWLTAYLRLREKEI
jgi:hypothetical protein